MKKFLVLILALLMALTAVLSSCANQNTDTREESNFESTVDTGRYVSQYSMLYPDCTIDELIERSVLVVRAKHKAVLDSEKRDTLVYTDHVFEVEEVFFGDKSVGDEITVQFIGGVIDDHEYIYEDQIDISESNEVIMILDYPTDGNDEIVTTDRYTFHPPMGVLDLTDEKSDEGDVYYEAYAPSVKYTADEMRDLVDSVKG